MPPPQKIFDTSLLHTVFFRVYVVRHWGLSQGTAAGKRKKIKLRNHSMSSVFTDVYDAAQPGKFDRSDERDCLTRYFRHTGFFSSLQALVTNRMPVWFRAHLLSLSRWTLSSAVEMSFAPFLPMLLRLKSSSESCKSRKLPITSLQRSKSTAHNNTKKAAILRKFSTFYTNKKYLQLILFYKISLNPSCHHNKPLVTSVLC